MHNELSGKIQRVHNFEALVDFLRDSLNWPILEESMDFEEITFDWSAGDLELDAGTQARIIGCRQLQLFDLKFDLSAVNNNPGSQQQPLMDFDFLENQHSWGIFFIQFNNDVALDACRTLLRRVLRGLVGGYNHSASLPFWDYDRLLFICTTADFQSIGFACFSGRRGRPIVNDYIPLHHFKLDA